MRTQMIFLVLLTKNAGFTFDDSKLDPDTVLAAMVASFQGDETKLLALLGELVG